MFLPKPFNIFSHEGGCAEDLNEFRFFFKGEMFSRGVCD